MKRIEQMARTRIPVRMVMLVAIAQGGVLGATPASALEYECNLPDDQRFVRVELPGEDHLCEVSVSYQSGERRVMWYADNDTSFCVEKSGELVTKYQDTWNFSCTRWPDRSGLDQLAAGQLHALEAELQVLIQAGQDAEPTFRVESMRAVASPSNEYLVMQFFITRQNSEASDDVTRILQQQGDGWQPLAEVDQLTSQVSDSNGEPVETALIDSISDGGQLTVMVSSGFDGQSHRPQCQGQQAFQINESGSLEVSSDNTMNCL